MRLIDADALVIDYYDDYETKDDEYSYPYVSEAQIDSAPSIDIVRCRECKYAEVSISPITGLWCIRFGINDMAMAADDFCSYGERKEQ